MAETGEGLGGIEKRLTTLEERVDEGFTQIDQRFAQIDQRFAEVDQRFAEVDQRFAQVDQRFAQVDQRFAQVDQRFETLTEEVQQLRVLTEDNTEQIKRIAEVQVHHGLSLDDIRGKLEKLEPLVAMKDLFEKVARDHERRITALEQSSSTG